MVRITGIEERQAWDGIVRSFSDYDVYYLSGYVKAFQIHGDGEPRLLYYESDEYKSTEAGLRAIYVYMLRRIDETTFDTITPYGYGGVLFEGEVTEESLGAFRAAYQEAMQEQHVVSNFVRYHPVLRNAGPMKQTATVTDLGKTIALDLSSAETIWDNIHSKNRNMIRKAEKNGVEIRHGQGLELLERFRDIYNATMDKDHAEEYYYFGRAFYESIDRDLRDNYRMFWAEYEGKTVAMSIMIFANGRLNYHLSGSLAEYRSLAPSNLLLYRAALWGCEQGMKTFHLGGGVGSGEDNLYKFKAAFNKNSDYRFSIGKEIIDGKRYDELVRQRKAADPAFDAGATFFPLYRA